MFGKKKNKTYTEKLKEQLAWYQQELRDDQARKEQWEREHVEITPSRVMNLPEDCIANDEEQIRYYQFALQNYTDEMASEDDPRHYGVEGCDGIRQSLGLLHSALRDISYTLTDIDEEKARKHPRQRELNSLEKTLQHQYHSLDTYSDLVFMYYQRIIENIIDKDVWCPLYDFEHMLRITEARAEKAGHPLKIKVLLDNAS